MFKRLLALMFALGLACLPALPATAVNDLQVTVRPGFDGTVRPGNWIPVDVNLVNSGPNVNGNLELDVERRATSQGGSSTSNNVTYTVPVVVPQHSSKRFSTSIYVPPFFDQIQVRLVANNQILYNQNISVQRVDPTQIDCGVLSTDPSAFASLNGLTLADGRRQPHLIQIDLPDLPTNPQLLSSLDCLIVSDYSTRGLSALQQTALSVWVDNGGVLAIGTGASGAGTLAGLPSDLLPARMSGTVPVRSLSGLASYFGASNDPNGPWLMAGLQPTDGTAVASDESQPLLVVGHRGKGAVILAAFSFTQKPIRGWNGFNQFWSYALSYVPISASVFNSYYRQQYGWGRSPRDVLVQNAAGADADSRRLLYAIIVFALLVGPVNFLVLARLGRRELSLVTVPVLAVAVTVGTLVYASRHQQGDVVMNQVSIARTWDGSGIGELHSYVGVYALHAQSIHLQVPLNDLLSNTMYPFPGGLNRTVPTLQVVDRGSPEIQGLSLEPGTLASFIVDGSLDQPGRIQSGLTLKGNEVDGQVTNGLSIPIHDAAILAGNDVQSLGDLRPGASHGVSIHLGTSSPTAARELGAALDRLYPPSPKDANAPRGMQYSVLNAALNPAVSYGGQVETSGVTLIGWLDGPLGAVQDPSTHRDATQSILFITDLPLKIGSQTETIPPQLLDWSQLTASYSARVDSTGISINAGDEAAFEYHAPVDPARFTLRGMTLATTSDVPATGTLDLYDWRAANWVGVPYAAGNLSIPAPDRFYSATGAVRLRFQYKPAPGASASSLTFTRFQLQLTGSGR